MPVRTGRLGRRRAIILPGVRIGPRAVVGAGSVVTRGVPEGVFAAGNPCRVLREITEQARNDESRGLGGPGISMVRVALSDEGHV